MLKTGKLGKNAVRYLILFDHVFQRDDELERLRREVQRYRLELTNRESSFNRMFTDHHPVIVDGKPRKTSSGLMTDSVSSFTKGHCYQEFFPAKKSFVRPLPG